MGTTTPVPDLATSGLAFVLQDSGCRYGRYTGDPSRAQLDRYFHLDAADRELVDVRRGERNCLGFAVQLGTVRFLGTFLADPIDVPELVVAHVAAQLGIPDPGMFKGYAQRRSTQWEHAAGHAWEGAREEVCRSLGHDASADRELTEVAGELDAAYRAVAARLPENTAVRIETVDGRDRPVLTPLDRLDEPPSLLALREQVTALLPRVDLPDLLLEVADWTGFPVEFTHVSEGTSRAEDLHLSVCAVLVAEACNIGLEPLVEPGRAALTRARLSWVEQNYLRADTITAANTRLVDAQTDIDLARAWGGGEVASADGLRFVVPVRTLNAGPNPRYFGPGRGVTYLNFLSDQFSGFHAVVVPGTLRDSLYILEGLLEQHTSLRPAELMTDNAGYTDQVFGLFRLLGYQFSPRLADLGDARFWRTNLHADYGPLNGIARHRVNTDLIASSWDDLLRVAGSLSTGTVRASEILRVLQGGGRPTPTGRAIAELGRIAKTLYLLAYLDDEPYRRRILTQLNRIEARHALARQVFHGQRGQLRQRYREGQEDQLGALGLVLNAIVLWNTRYLDAALAQLRREGYLVEDADVERLSPLIHDHINLLGVPVRNVSPAANADPLAGRFRCLRCHRGALCQQRPSMTRPSTTSVTGSPR